MPRKLAIQGIHITCAGSHVGAKPKNQQCLSDLLLGLNCSRPRLEQDSDNPRLRLSKPDVLRPRLKSQEPQPWFANIAWHASWTSRLCNIIPLPHETLSGYTGFSYFCEAQITLHMQFNFNNITYSFYWTKVINAKFTTVGISGTDWIYNPILCNNASLC